MSDDIPRIGLPHPPAPGRLTPAQRRELAWEVLVELAEKGSKEDAVRYQAARAIIDLTLLEDAAAAKSPGEADPDPLGTLARAQGGER